MWKVNIELGSWIYATHRITVIHPCTKYCTPMSIQKKGMGRTRKHVKNPINLTLRCRGKIELNYLFSWLLQCNLPGVETKASANAFGFSISNNIFPPQRIFAIYTKTRVLILKSSVISEISFHCDWNKISSHKKCMGANDESKENWIIKSWEKAVFY